MNDQSPHNSRIFSAHILMAGTNLALWVFLVSMFSFNIFALSHWHLSYSDNLFEVFTHPLSWSAHMTLAQTFWQNKATDGAKRELGVAQELFPSKNDSVLGVSTTPLNLLATWTEEPKKKEQEVQFWQHVVGVHPDYRDGYIQLASLSYANGSLADAQDYIAKAQALDPNGKIVQKLADFLSKK